jgi:predicted ATPase
MEAGHGARAAELAVRFDRGQDDWRAVRYRQQASENARRRWAYREVIDHLTAGLERLQRLPETAERHRQELDLQLALAGALIVIEGQAAPGVGRAYTQAWELSQQVGEAPQQFAALRGLRRFYSSRTEHRRALELGEQLLNLAQRTHDPVLLPEARSYLGLSSFYLGDLIAARAQLEQGSALYDTPQHRSHGINYGQVSAILCLSYAALTLWSLGYPEQAVKRSHVALTLAHELTYPFGQVVAHVLAAWFHQYRREVQAAQEADEAAMALATAQGFALWLAEGTILRGWALAARRQGAQGIAQMRQGLAAYRATGGEVARSYFLGLLAEGYRASRDAEAGLKVLAEALASAHATGTRFYEAELYRLRGELRLRGTDESPAPALAEEDFRRAPRRRL